MHTSENSDKTDKLTLEEIVHITNKVGLEYVAAKKEADRLDMMKNPIKSKIMLSLDDGKISEAKLRRLAETNQEYLDLIKDYSDAKAESERLRIRYESYKNLFEARRSMLSYMKAEMKLI